MSDDRTNRNAQDRTRINISEFNEVQYWSKKFGVTPDQLREAVKRVGNQTDAVARELKRAA